MAENSYNSIKIKYALRESEAYVMSAHVECAATASSLRALNYVSKALRIKTDVDTTSLQRGSVERLFRVTIAERNEEELLLDIFMFVYQTIFFHYSLVTINDIIDSIGEEKRDIALSLLKQRHITDEVLATLFNNNTIKKNRNTFYKTLKKKKKIESISLYNGLDFDFSTNKKSLEVKADCFRRYITDISPEIVQKVNERIYLEAPVVVEDEQLKWIGIYNKKRIRFKMDSAEFRSKSQNGEIPFKNGLYIICKIEYKEVKDDDDNIIFSDFRIKEVYGFGVEDNYALTIEGKKKVINDSLPSLFSEEDLK